MPSESLEVSNTSSPIQLIAKEEKKKRKKKDGKDNKTRKKKKEKGSKRKHAVPDNKHSKKRKRVEESHHEKPSLHEQIVDYRFILAPMVGASELAFRLLCRKYGATLAYTPMISSTQFVRDEDYREEELQTIPEDRPLVCHFSANNPQDFSQAAKLCEPHCDAIDLNLGCPQRTAHVGHFGSYLLNQEDRDLVLRIVRAGVEAVSIPICVKIRLLDTLEETVALCEQLRDAGASWIAIHARYRASFERKGPGARDGPALLDQVEAVKEKVRGIPIIANGNVITYQDIEKNLDQTKADGIMSAEGILDNPALFLPRHGTDSDRLIEILDPPHEVVSHRGEKDTDENVDSKRKRKLLKKLRQIEKMEQKQESGEELNDEQREKLATKKNVKMELAELEQPQKDDDYNNNNQPTLRPARRRVTLGELQKAAQDKLILANEYLDLVRRYPIKMRTVVFHTRRMLRDELNQFQLMEDCVACRSVAEVQVILDKMKGYRNDPGSFLFDKEKAARQKEALERKKHEEGKRKAFEARMIRKAKREGKSDLEHYLRAGAEVPTLAVVRQLKQLPRKEQLELWKKNHSRHCLSYHLEGCKRDRACAFLHMDVKGANTFDEGDEVAG